MAADDEVQGSVTQYDLTHKLSPFLDRHLIFPIFQFLQESDIYPTIDLMRAKIALLVETNMIDFAEDMYGEINEEPPDSLAERREQVLEQLNSSRDDVLPLLTILEDEEKMQELKRCKSVQDICTAFQLEADVIETLFDYARLQFHCGNYSLTAVLLRHYRSMTLSDAERPVTEKQMSALWGSLASFILNADWDEAAGHVFKLDDFLEANTIKMTKHEQLLQKSWLLHWSLFIIFKSPSQQTKLLDLFLNEKNLSIISISCPHLFRYVGACLILHKRLKHLVKDTVSIIHYESQNYKDPITAFLIALYVDMDFDEAQRELKKCKEVLQVDYFLHEAWTEFEENARLLIFETYCRIHQCINIGMIATKLNMRPEEAELWIVKLIQSAKLDARIDSEKSRVLMAKQPPNVYQQVIERTKNLSFRSTMILSNLDKAKGDKR